MTMIPTYRLPLGDALAIPFRFVELTSNPQGSYDFARPHRHAYFEIFFFAQGEGDHEIDFDEHAIRSPSLHVVTPGRIHRIARRGDSRGCVLIFTEEFLALSRPDRLRAGRPPILRRGIARPIIDLSTDEAQRVAARIDLLRQESGEDAAGHREALGALLNLLLIDVERIVATKPTDKPAESSTEQALIDRFIDALDESFHALHGVGEYATMLNVTPGHLNDIVRTTLGNTAGGMIRDRILLEARRLLAHSDETIKEIAYALGYDDPSYFTRLFREQIGEPPGDFRQRFR